jgi:hypothetical protein
MQQFLKMLTLVEPQALNTVGYPDKDRMIYPTVSSGTNYLQFINRLTSAGFPSATGTGSLMLYM